MAKSATTPIVLAAPDTNAGAMERLFMLEAANPSSFNYRKADNLMVMRLMRQTIENRLKSSAEYNARGAITETDIVELGNQFAGFGDYPTLDATMSANLMEILAIANNPRHPQQADYAQFVQDSITAATEAIVPPTAAYPDVTAWRTLGSPTPGGRFRAVATISGNTFYSTTPVLPMQPKHARQSKHRKQT